MKFSVSINDRDYLAYNICHARYSKAGKRGIKKARAMLAALAAIGLVLTIISWFVYDGKVWVSLLYCLLPLVAAVWSLIYPATLKNTVEKNVVRLKKSGKLPYTANAEFEFTADEIIETTPKGVQKIPYGDVEEVITTSEHIFIMLDTVRAFIIPKRVTARKTEKLVGILQAKCGKVE